MFVYHILKPLRFGWLLVLSLFQEEDLHILKYTDRQKKRYKI